MKDERARFVATQQAEQTAHVQELAARATQLRWEREEHMQVIERIRKKAAEQEQRHATALEADRSQDAAESRTMQAHIQEREQFLQQLLTDMERMVQHINDLRNDKRELKRKAQEQAEEHSAALQEMRAVNRRRVAALQVKLDHAHAHADELTDLRHKLDDRRQQLRQAALDSQKKQHRQATERLVVKQQAQIDRMVEQFQRQERENCAALERLTAAH